MMRRDREFKSIHSQDVVEKNNVLPQNITSAITLADTAIRQRRSLDCSDSLPRIMVVDDLETNRIIVEILLCELGFCSDHARNGREAVELCKRFKYDLILMDYHMPIMNGHDAAKEILKSASHPIQIFACTSDQTQEVNQFCFGAGMKGIITKPVTTTKLRKILFSIFDQ